MVRQSILIDFVSFVEYHQLFLLVYIAVMLVSIKYETNTNQSCRLVGRRRHHIFTHRFDNLPRVYVLCKGGVTFWVGCHFES